MSTGALLLPPGYHPLINGAVVPSGKLNFTRTGTTTAQDTYTDADLSVANANPVILNSTGGLDTLVYGDPTTGFRYRMRVYSSADVLLDTHDDLLVFGADTASFAEGSFTGTLTGMDASTTATVSYRITQNSAGTGKVCTLFLAAAFTGTSNTTALTMTGLPAAVTPSVARLSICAVTDEGITLLALASVGTSSVITFSGSVDDSGTGSTKTGFNATSFLNSGTKGLPASWTISYPL